MSFSSDLRNELARNGIRGTLADRIVAEFDDHLACDPKANVGAPAEIADRFAAELRIVRTRRASIGAFAALALCAIVFVVVVATHGRSGPAPSWLSATSALVAIAGAQIAFVAGVLALVRALRSRTAGDLRIAQRRGSVALAAGALVALGLAATGALYALVALPGLVFAARASRNAAAITPDEGARGLAADLPFPRVSLALLGAAGTGVIFLQGIVGERSLEEGLVRGGIEAAGLLLGVAVLGRPLGLFSSAR